MPAHPRTLLVAWRYPPSVGGMQTHTRHLFEQCSRRTSTRLIALGRQTKLHLIWFFPLMVVRVLNELARGRVDYILCADAATLMVLLPVLRVRRPTVAVVVYGLDLVVPNPVYQRWLKRALRRADRVVAISDATADIARSRGVADERLVILRPGVEVPGPRPAKAEARSALLRLLGLDESAFVMLTLGRLVPRKGVRWFVSEVLPNLPDAMVYISAGRGPEERPVRGAATRGGVGRRFHLLGAVDEELRETLLRGADVFVMPNVPVPGDREGFGLVAAEAALRGTPVVASRIEGIVDAVIEGETGALCEPMNAAEFADTLRALAADRGRLAELGKRAAAAALDRFPVEKMDEGFGAAFGIASQSSARLAE